MEEIFGNSVQVAVQTSLRENKALFVFLSGGDNSSEEFLSKFLYDSNGRVDEKVIGILKKEYIGLKLLRNTTEFGYFESIFQRLTVPSFYFVRQNDVIGIITNETSDASFREVLQKGTTKPPAAREPVPAAESLVESAGDHLHQTGETTGEGSLQPQQFPTLSEFSASNSHNGSNVAKQKNEYKIKKAMREEEANRIRRLLENDRKERESWKRQSKGPAPEDKSFTAEDRHYSSSRNSSNCALLIKLFDGSTLKHDFESSQTLNDVRNWLEEETQHEIIPASMLPSFATSSGQTPSRYVFHRPALPRVTYSDVEEFKPLRELGLPPRSALILKPIYEEDKSYKSYPDSVGPLGMLKSVASSLGRLSGALYSFFDYSIDNNQEDGQSMFETHVGVDADEQGGYSPDHSSNDAPPRDSFATSKSPSFLVIDGPRQSPSLINIHHLPRDPPDAISIHESPSPPNDIARDQGFRSRTSTPKPFVKSKSTGRIQVLHDGADISNGSSSSAKNDENDSVSRKSSIKDEEEDRS